MSYSYMIVLPNDFGGGVESFLPKDSEALHADWEPRMSLALCCMSKMPHLTHIPSKHV